MIETPEGQPDIGEVIKELNLSTKNKGTFKECETSKEREILIRQNLTLQEIMTQDNERIKGTLGHLIENLLPYYIANPQIVVCAEDGSILDSFDGEKRFCNDKHVYESNLQMGKDVKGVNNIVFKSENVCSATTHRFIHGEQLHVQMSESMQDFVDKLNKSSFEDACDMITLDHKHYSTFYCFHQTGSQSMWFTIETLIYKLKFIPLEKLSVLFEEGEFCQIKICKIPYSVFASKYLAEIDPKAVLEQYEIK